MLTTDPFVEQKDRLLQIVNKGTLESYSVVYANLLAYYRPWVAADYHYKGAEIADRCAAELANKRFRGEERRRAANELGGKFILLRNEFRKAEAEWKRG